jgi:deazaflavin-dependent oxidoreductase (nitroreductase family)
MSWGAARAGRFSVKAKKESRSAWRGVGRIVVLAVLSLVALMTMLTLFSLVLRHGGAWVRDGIRVLNKRVLNPAMMKLAGRRHWYTAVIRHTGRRSGRKYATPVVAVPAAGDAFIIPLPYGESVDWLKNVLASGRAEIEAKGETYDLIEPEVIDAASAFPLLDERHRRTWRRFGIERFLRLKRTHRDLAAPRWEELREFRATHPPKHVTVDGAGWEYIAGGEGEEALLILPGGRWSARPASPASRPSRIATGSSRRATRPCPPRPSSSTGWWAFSTPRACGLRT